MVKVRIVQAGICSCEVEVKLRLELLEHCGYDVDKVIRAVNFVTGAEQNYPKPQSDRLADGIYIVNCNGKAVLYTVPDTEIVNDTIGIGVVQGSRSLIVGLDDAASTVGHCSTLTTKTGGSHFFKRHTDAVADWDGSVGTEDLREILNPDIKLDDGWYIPSLGQMYFIFCHLKAINEALAFVGGRPLELEAGVWYWSSTNYDANYTWNVGIKDGFTDYDIKDSNKFRVRPVSAFL